MATISSKLSDSIRDAVDKLSNILVCYKGEWVYMSGINNDWSVSLTPIKNGIYNNSAFVVNLSQVDEKDLLFAYYPLGFVKTSKSLYYASRIPLRKNKFGLRQENLEFAEVFKGLGDNFTPNRVWENILVSGNLHDLLAGPSGKFADAVDSLNAGKDFAIFHRDFAIKRATRWVAQIYYKTSPAGEVDIRNLAGELYPSYVHLKERLVEECGVPSRYFSN